MASQDEGFGDDWSDQDNEGSSQDDQRTPARGDEQSDQPLVEVHDDPALDFQALLSGAMAELPETFLVFEEPVQLHGIASEKDLTLALSKFVSPLIQMQEVHPSDKPVVTTTDKILNAVLPPRTFVIHDPETGRAIHFAQPVSKKQALKEDLHQLNENLEFMLQNCKARSQGICPVRSTIVDLLADELLRQVAIDQPERGLLLRRIRDEAKMTIEAYKCLHEAASQYGAQKLLDGARGVPEMVATIEQLKKETESLHKEVKRLESRHASLVRCVEEQVQTDGRRHNEEKAFLENSKKRLQQHLEDVKKMQEAERRALTEGA